MRSKWAPYKISPFPQQDMDQQHKANIAMALHDLARFANNTATTTGSWSAHLLECAMALETFAEQETLGGIKEKSQIYDATPKEILNAIPQLVKKLREGATAIRRKRDNPQIEITVTPYVERAKKAVQLWHYRVAQLKEQTAPAPETLPSEPPLP